MDNFDEWTIIHGPSVLNTEFLTSLKSSVTEWHKNTAIQTTSSPQSFSI